MGNLTLCKKQNSDLEIHTAAKYAHRAINDNPYLHLTLAEESGVENIRKVKVVQQTIDNYL